MFEIQLVGFYEILMNNERISLIWDTHLGAKFKTENACAIGSSFFSTSQYFFTTPHNTHLPYINKLVGVTVCDAYVF